MQAYPVLSTASADTASSISSSAVGRAIVIGGLAVGVLDALDGVVFAAVTSGQNPIQVLQWIASGALGSRAFAGGLATAGLGALMHFALSFGFTAAIVLAWTRLEVVRKNWIAVGLAWGAAVWAFMNLVVLPLSQVTPAPLTVASVVNGIVGHALTVGLAATYVANREGVRQAA